MNAYWKYNLKYSKQLHFPKLKNPTQNLNELTSGFLNEDQNTKKMRISRSWRVDELRLKSDSDLHKLWYVLLKEKLAIKSDQYLNSQDIMNARYIYFLKNALVKVHNSMSRLRAVVGERKAIRNEFMKFLEFYYIKKKQANPEYILLEQSAKTEKRDKTKKAEEGSPTEPELPEEKKRVVRAALSEETTAETREKKEDTPKPVSVLDENELKHVEKLTKRYKQKELLKEYVSNSHLLRDRTKRQVVAAIHGSRAKQAKHIFMKEMAAISYKVKHLKQSDDPNVRKLENLS